MDAIVRFLIKQIKNSTVSYDRVIASRPDLKSAIDAYLLAQGSR